MDEERPQRIGRYRVIDEIGRGGQGVVYRVHDDELGVDLAIKVLPTEGVSAEVVERMRREVLLSRRVRHDGICRLHDLKTEAGRTFVVMEYVEGTPLDRLLDQGALPLGRALQIVGALASAVAAVHAAGVVHRDLKPDNVIIGPDGPVVLVDFGVATADDLPSLTTINGIIGTRRYIPPEVWLGAPAGPLADVFALGVLLYECLTGVEPYAAAKNTAQTLTFSSNSPRIAAANLPRFIPPSERNRNVPSFVDDVVRRATAASPAERTPSAQALANDIRALQERFDSPTAVIAIEPLAPARARTARAPPSQRLRASAALSAGGLVIAGCLVTLTIWWLIGDTVLAAIKGDAPGDVRERTLDAGSATLALTADAGGSATRDAPLVVTLDPLDAGALDAGPLDAGVHDAGALDAGALDTGALDTVALAPVLAIDAGVARAEPAGAHLSRSEIELRARALGLRAGDLPSFEAALERVRTARTNAARERGRSWASAALDGFHLTDAFIERKVARVSALFMTASPAAQRRARASLDLAVFHAAAHHLEPANVALNAALDELAR